MNSTAVVRDEDRITLNAEVEVADFLALSTQAAEEIEDEIQREKPLDAEGHPFYTGVEISLARLMIWIRLLSEKHNLRVIEAFEELVDLEGES